MNNLSLIAVIGPNRELGYNNKLLWHIKEDLAFYKAMTMNKNIIMGRLTLESMPKSALKGRKPIVLTRSNIVSTDKIKYFDDIEKLLELIRNTEEEFMVVGGAKIYEQFLPYVNTMYLTSIDNDNNYECDCYFPKFNIYDWETQLLKEGNEGEISYQIKKYIRRK